MFRAIGTILIGMAIIPFGMFDSSSAAFAFTFGLLYVGVSQILIGSIYSSRK